MLISSISIITFGTVDVRGCGAAVEVDSFDERLRLNADGRFLAVVVVVGRTSESEDVVKGVNL